MPKIFLWACLAIVGTVRAEPLPYVPPETVYADADRAASAVQAPPGRRSEFRRRIQAALQENPRNVTALVHRAYLFNESGDPERARRDFDAALDAVEPGSELRRRVLWSRGWAAFDTGDHAAALADWREEVVLHGGRPFWVPYTYALLYWSAGMPVAATDWYDAAVRSQPEWGHEAGVEARIRHWRPAQRVAMRGLFEAWKQRRR